MSEAGERGLLIAGIDEAGYGPRVGPLAVAMSAWRVRVPEEESRAFAAPDLWRLLRPAVTRSITKGTAGLGAVAIADSKALKRANTSERPLEHLERGVLAALALLGREGATSADLLRAVGASVEGAAWAPAARACEGGACVGPEGARILANVLRRRMDRAGVELLDVRCELMDEGAFNGALRDEGNKAGVSFSLAALHLRRVWAACEGGEGVVVVDRQGGRKRYGRELARALGVAVRAVSEEDEESVYLAEDGRRRLQVRFVVEGEGRCLATALASMTAKLCRERAMAMFNAHFGALAPGVRGTAGYGTDGRRWIEEMKVAVGEAAVAAVVRRA